RLLFKSAVRVDDVPFHVGIRASGVRHLALRGCFRSGAFGGLVVGVVFVSGARGLEFKLAAHRITKRLITKGFFVCVLVRHRASNTLGLTMKEKPNKLAPEKVKTGKEQAGEDDAD